MWLQLVYAIAMALISAALAPKPKNRPPTNGSLDVPTTPNGEPLPVYFGTVWEKNAKVYYYGNPAQKAIKSGGGKK